MSYDWGYKTGKASAKEIGLHPAKPAAPTRVTVASHTRAPRISKPKMPSAPMAPQPAAQAPTQAEMPQFAKGGAVKCAKGGGIHIKPENKGKLHAKLGIPAGQKIPAAKISKAKNSSSAAERKEATFAQNAAKWNKK